MLRVKIWKVLSNIQKSNRTRWVSYHHSSRQIRRHGKNDEITRRRRKSPAQGIADIKIWHFEPRRENTLSRSYWLESCSPAGITSLPECLQVGVRSVLVAPNSRGRRCWSRPRKRFARERRSQNLSRSMTPEPTSPGEGPPCCLIRGRRTNRYGKFRDATISPSFHSRIPESTRTDGRLGLIHMISWNH